MRYAKYILCQHSCGLQLGDNALIDESNDGLSVEDRTDSDTFDRPLLERTAESIFPDSTGSIVGCKLSLSPLNSDCVPETPHGLHTLPGTFSGSTHGRYIFRLVEETVSDHQTPWRAVPVSADMDAFSSLVFRNTEKF
jgi:hypothetical protein